MQRGGRCTRESRAEVQEPHIGPENQADSDEGMGYRVYGRATGTEGEDIREPTLRDLTAILQAFMGQQEVWDGQLKEEAMRQEALSRASIVLGMFSLTWKAKKWSLKQVSCSAKTKTILPSRKMIEVILMKTHVFISVCANEEANTIFNSTNSLPSL